MSEKETKKGDKTSGLWLLYMKCLDIRQFLFMYCLDPQL